MVVKELSPDEAVGHVLMRNLVGNDGRTVMSKGRRLQASDSPNLAEAGVSSIPVGLLEPGDLGEDEAAQALAEVVAGPGLRAALPRNGRVDLFAEARGVLRVAAQRLHAANILPGVATSTLADHAVVSPDQRVATVKVVPYAMPRATIDEVRRLAADKPLCRVDPFVVSSAVLVTTGREGTPGEVADAFGAALRRRLEGVGIDLLPGPHAAEEEGAIRDALLRAAESGAGMILVAGKTSITDEDDLVPRAVRAAGGEAVGHGVPVEPGSLFFLAYRGEVPVVGLPGCVRSAHRNAFDLVLPRLAAGERLTRRDLAELGHGGLLD